MPFKFAEEERDISILLAELHKYESLTCYFDDQAISFLSSKNNGVTVKFNKKLVKEFISIYKGKYIFMDCVDSVHSLIKLLFNNKIENLKYFQKLDDVSSLISVSSIKSCKYKEVNKPLQKMCSHLNEALKLWCIVEVCLPEATNTGQIELYSSILQPSILPLLKMKLIHLDKDVEKKKEYEKEANEFDLWLSKRCTPVVKYNEYLKEKDKEKDYHSIFNPYNENHVKELCFGMGYPRYDSIYELLWTGDYEEVIFAIIKANEAKEKSPMLLPSGYKWIEIEIDEYVPPSKETMLNQAGTLGYIDGYKGLRLYTPLSKQSILGSSMTPPNVIKEYEEAISKVHNSSYLQKLEVLSINQDLIPIKMKESKILFIKKK